MMNIFNVDLSNDQLKAMERQYRADANNLLRKANRCFSIRIARDSAIALNEAQRAIDRTKNGVCSHAEGCDVHQLGSCWRQP